MAFADFVHSPAIAGFLSEIFLVALGLQATFWFLLWALLPLHVWVSDRYGAKVAFCFSNFATVAFAHLVAILLTLPALLKMRRGKIQKSKSVKLVRVLRDLPLVGLNFAFSLAVGSAAAIFTCKEEVKIDIQAGLPDSQLLVAQAVFSILVSEAIFYHLHRAFHETKYLYAKIHKIHHTWPAPVAIMATYAHPLEHIFCNLATVFTGPVLCGAHPFVSLSYSLLFSVGAAVHHSGYWSDDLGIHDLHHELFNVNYGNAHILDYLYGTYRSQSLCRGVQLKEQTSDKAN
eukprot:CAMPEP_0197652952 /NCGR_PEP_ID=MMETSP1338-20131121/34757_1 /TAXON_ID=43686 ORGANISM="Pelagodinium beii, Strain RCC1491" /NCGR_SAMPLE_ID=MMETSP1338 /ASSEMBLY_ACC=CAM_ASM_000754 /LENGTH=287 /DNA_ID=CAMNT_0043227925 /DNA_START=33 /DNA_END=896 /DNA_ORIENTATION=-